MAKSTYMVTIGGSNSRLKIERAISGEEALGCKFGKSQITAIDGKITNVATFSEEDAVPNEIKVLEHLATAPEGYSAEWSGVMVVSGTNQVVDIFRKS